MKILEDADPFTLYGRWNGLAAWSSSSAYFGYVAAHDGDFFPESVMDYVAALRSGFDPAENDFQGPLQPVRVDIDITQVCNARCIFCFSRPYQRKGYRGQWTRAEVLVRLIADLGRNGTRTIRFCGGGDPLVHPQIADVLPLPHRSGMQLCMITNLDFIDERLSSLLLEHVDHLRWSVNAASDATRLEIHRPGGGANLLSETFAEVRKLVERRERRGSGERRPMIWATFLILPNNIDEMIPATRALRDAGVDSVSFRPVFHGLGGQWTGRTLARASELLAEVAQLDERPRFCVFTPKRYLPSAAALNPNDYFTDCISRRVRTILEASSEGLAHQSCGMYRGRGPTPSLVVGSDQPFHTVWRRASTDAHPRQAPAECAKCIDVSMNLTLKFIADVLRKDQNAVFRRIFMEPKEVDGNVEIPRAPDNHAARG